jgi:transcriptional regulator with XRE-family HTH domain
VNPNIHEYLQERRIEMKLSIQQLSKESGISASHISRMERGVRSPSPQTLEKLAIPLHVEYVTLLKVANLLESRQSNISDLEKVLLNDICIYHEREISSDVKEKILDLLNQYVK